MAVGEEAARSNSTIYAEAVVGIGLNYPLLRIQYARFHWRININQHNPA